MKVHHILPPSILACFALCMPLAAQQAVALLGNYNGAIIPVASSAVYPVLSSAPNAAAYGYNATGVAWGQYLSGITATGTAGQTCLLATFNNSSTATATVYLTGVNTIAAHTPLVITSAGSGATSAPTTAAVSSGTATCSGTPVLLTGLGAYVPMAVDANGNLVTSGSNSCTLTGGCVLANGSTATTQSANDNSTKVATTAYADRLTAGTLPGSFTNVAAGTAVSAPKVISPAGAVVVPSGVQFVFKGDSLTHGYGLTQPQQSYPYQFCEYGPLAKNVAQANCVNLGQDGETLATMLSSYTAEVHPYCIQATAAVPVYLHLEAGVVDILVNGSSAATIEGYLTTYWADAVADGCTVTAATLTPTTQVGITGLATLVAVNKWIRSQVGLYSYLDDLQQFLPNPTDTTFYQSDGLHYSAAATFQIANFINGLWTGKFGFQTMQPVLSVSPPTMTLDNSCSFPNSSGSSFGCTMTITAGDGITCEYGYAGGNTVTSYVSDNKDSGHYAYSVPLFNPSGSSLNVAQVYYSNAVGGSTAITVTLGSSQLGTGACQAWKPSSPGVFANDTTMTQKADGGGSTISSGSTITPFNNNEVVIGYLVEKSGAVTTAAGANYTLNGVDTSDAFYPEYWIQTTATATNTPFVANPTTWNDSQVAYYFQ